MFTFWYDTTGGQAPMDPERVKIVTFRVPGPRGRGVPFDSVNQQGKDLSLPGYKRLGSSPVHRTRVYRLS